MLATNVFLRHFKILRFDNISYINHERAMNYNKPVGAEIPPPSPKCY